MTVTCISGYTLCNIFDYFFKYVSHCGGLIRELFTVCVGAASQNCRELVIENILCSWILERAHFKDIFPSQFIPTIYLYVSYFHLLWTRINKTKSLSGRDCRSTGWRVPRGKQSVARTTVAITKETTDSTDRCHLQLRPFLLFRSRVFSAFGKKTIFHHAKPAFSSGEIKKMQVFCISRYVLLT